MNEKKLEWGMRECFEKSKYFRIYYFIISIFVLVLPIVFAFQFSLTYGLYILLILRIIQFVINHKSKFWASKARTLHHYNLFCNGLGEAPPAGIFQDITLMLGNMPSISEERTYFESQRSVGPNRLIENVTESAFYTYAFSNFYKDIFIFGAIFFSIVVLGFFAIGDQISDKVMMTKILFGFIGFLFLGDSMNRFFELKNLSVKCDAITKEGLNLLGNNASSLELSKEFAYKYLLALSGTIPIPTLVYTLKNKSTSLAWNANLK